MDFMRYGKISEFFSTEQIDCMAQALYQSGDKQKLVRFFEADKNLFTYFHFLPSVLRAYLYSLFYSGRYQELYKTMAENKFDPKMYTEMQKLWFEAKYAEDQLKKNKALGPVEKYRLRRKYRPPLTIWDGHDINYTFRVKDREILKGHYRRNKYPNPQEKRIIAQETGLDVTQISNWFKNRRQRDKPSPEIPMSSASFLNCHSC